MDEIIGHWENGLDDLSGINVIFGWAFTFNEDGTGEYNYWSGGGFTDKRLFKWCRISENLIKAKYEDEDTWAEINYTLSTDNNYQNLKKLIDRNYISEIENEEGFWDSEGAIFKRQ